MKVVVKVVWWVVKSDLLVELLVESLVGLMVAVRVALKVDRWGVDWVGKMVVTKVELLVVAMASYLAEMMVA